MDSAGRTFREFLAVLESTLDEHDLTAEDVAARLHLSRFHADRLVAAASGETPTALRRRILLERAADRLRRSDTSVLDVAIDAGFESHEGFTRAFTRAYGVPPSTWRHEQRDHRLPAPSRVHFHPPASLRLAHTREVTAMDLLLRLVEHHVWLVGEMLDRAATLDQDTLDAPIIVSVEGIDDDPTLLRLLARLVGQLAMWEASVQGDGYDVGAEHSQSLGQVRATYDVAGPAFVSLVRGLVRDGELGDTFVDAACEPARVFTYGGMVGHVLTFAAHRRTLVCGALIDAGITDLGAGDPMEWVAREAG